MSAQAAPLSPDLSLIESPAGPRRSPWRRVRRTIYVLLAILIVFSLAAGELVFNPRLLEALSAMVLKPKPGTVPWNGQDRITVVAMGLTQRTTEPARTDTLLVIDIDPVNHRVNELSVPRDLWVNIPGYGMGKLAIAYEVGGPQLAAYTLEKDLDIPVDYSIALTFKNFTKLVNAMGGVTVNVPMELKDPLYPCLVGYDYCPIDIKPGVQHMDGATALEFVRERHAFAQQDLARVQDQQAFSEAVKRTLISPSTWLRYPAILATLRQGLITDIPLNALPEMGVQFMLARGGVHHSYINIENGLVQSGWSNDGQSVLTPTNSTGIPNLVHTLFADPQLARESASVEVLNGSSTSGQASDAESLLSGLGFHVVGAGNADRTTYTRSQVVLNTAASGPGAYTARRLQRLLHADLVQRAVPGQSARIVVIIGSQYP